MSCLKIITLTLASIILVSCGWRRHQLPTKDIRIDHPKTWRAAAHGQQKKISTGWLQEFGSPPLTRAVEQALVHNHDLQIAAARMREANASSIVARSQLLPSADLSLGSSVNDRLSSATGRNHALSLSATWEIDLWGRLGNLRDAAYANEQAALDDYRNARLSLAANAAKAWCSLISADQELTLAQATLESYEKNLRIIERNYIGTGEGALDIQFGRNNVSSAKRALESRKLDLDEAARSLELLLGQYPDGRTRHGKILPKIRAMIPAGLPANLLERRPDLSAAKARLFASVESAHAARKALLPSFALTAGSSNTTESFSKLLDLNQLVHTLSARLTQSLTRGGALSAAARAAVERNQAQLHRYAQTVLSAFREVESALAADRSLAAQEVHLDSELKQAALAERQAERDYSEGINPNILSVLEAQRRANNARASMIRLRNRRLQNRIDLHLALGGDFESRQ